MEPTLPRPTGGFATRAITGTTTVPDVRQQPSSAGIWLASTWATEHSAEVGALLSDAQEGYVYGRYDNPTATTLHTVIASLHGAQAAWSFASGTAAIHASLASVRSGGRILATSSMYGGTWALLRRLERDAGWQVDHAPLATADDARAALNEAHTVLYVETIANPSMAVTDLPAIAAVCRDRDVALVVDNTFASPYLCRPVELGATLAVESATKLIGGHGDVVAGVVAGDERLIADVRAQAVELGASLGAFEAWLVLRGIQTLALRVRQASASASVLARALADDPLTTQLRYSGLSEHPDHDLATTLFGGRGHGALLAFDLPSRAHAEAFADACELFMRAASLGGTHSLVIHPASTSHRQLGDEELAMAGLGAGTIRLSVGIEDVEDLLEDVQRGLAAAGRAGEAGS